MTKSFSGREFFDTIDNTFKEKVGVGPAIHENVQTSVVPLPRSVFDLREQRLKAIQCFFETTLQIFRDATDGKVSRELSDLLFNEVPDSYGRVFHRELPRDAWTVPRFFRTDESQAGQIFEIQCPGSGWGDLQLLTTAYSAYDSSDALKTYSPSGLIAKDINGICKCDSATVLHLLDNSSNPASMRFLIATTQPPLRYWAYDASVNNRECQFIRSHSFFGLLAENLFKSRLKKCSEGATQFDLPPILVFDQKAALCLPFLSETKSAFPDDIRNMLVYSHPVTSRGFADVDGTWTSLDSFLKRPEKKRRYFLKYAGCDVSINWGSRGVYRLHDNRASEYLKKAAEDAEQSRFWLIQPEVSSKETVAFFDKASGAEQKAKLTAKYSCFYSPNRLIGIKTMHRKHYKVHGQEETVIGIAVPKYFEELAASK